MKKLLICASTAVMLLLLLMPSAAKADDVWITLCETGFGCKVVASGTGSAVFGGSYGTYTLTIDTGFSDHHSTLDGDASQETGSGGPLLVYVTGLNFDNGGTPQQFNAGFTGSIVGGTGSVINYTYLDNGNSVCGLSAGDTVVGHTFAACTPGTLLTTIGPFTSGAFMGSAHGSANAVAPYSLTEAISLTLSGGATGHSLDGNITIPEPASLALLGSGLLLCGGLLRRRLFNR